MTLALAGLGIALGGLWLAFAYLGYPLILLALRRLAPRPVGAADVLPSVSIIIAVHDGAKMLEAKLRGTLDLDYDGPVEVLVASDASTDGSDEIARRFEGDGVRLIQLPERGGKEAAQAAGIAAASGEVLVFTDVSAELAGDALRCIVRPFADPSVGCVSSEDEVDSEEGEGLYVRMEMAVRRLESEAATLVGLSGSFFAARRELCSAWRTDLASDFRTALESARRGLRAVSEPTARARFGTSGDLGSEWRRKVRTVRRGIAVLAAYRDLLHPRHGRAALALWGHKLARFTSPFALLLLLGASSVAAGESDPARLLLAAQVLAYVGGGLALVSETVAGLRLPRLAGFFMLVNASMLVAWLYHLSGRRSVTWQPTRR